MDLRLIISTFLVIFLAELGDKTQLAAMAASAGSNQPFSVLVGAALALTLSSIIAVVIGSVIGKVIPMQYLKIAAGVVFLFFGALYIKEAVVKEKEITTEAAAPYEFFGKSMIRAAWTFEQRELDMIVSARDAIQTQECRAVLDKLIAEEKEHLMDLSKLKRGGGVLIRLEHRKLTELNSGQCCGEEEDSALLQELYQRQMAMAEFYHLMAQKSKFRAAKSTFEGLHCQEVVHAKEIYSLFSGKT